MCFLIVSCLKNVSLREVIHEKMDHESTLEEGEISNDSDNNYTPLERPPLYSSNAQPNARFTNVVNSESDEELGSSDSDSDSDSAVRKTKKPKIKLKPKTRYRRPAQKKYDIWSTRVQDEVLAETLNSCDVTVKDRSRNAETYDFSMGKKYGSDDSKKVEEIFKEEHRTTNKRTRADRNNTHFRQTKRSHRENEGDNVTRKSRMLLDLNVNVDSSEEEIAKDIANKLYEEKEDLIIKVVNILGKRKAIELYEETKSIEKDGGMLIMNQTRRRTPGGVFLFLVRHDKHITYQQQHSIFDEERSNNKQKSRLKSREKYRKMKEKIASSKPDLLPDLLTRAELYATQNSVRKSKEQIEENEVINPPPTPETDGGHENSGEENVEYPLPIVNGSDLPPNRGKLNTYDEDFLDLGCSADMDLF